MQQQCTESDKVSRQTDPRLAATKSLAIGGALKIFRSEGVAAVTFAAVSSETGISRSTLYRHWPSIQNLRNDTLLNLARPPEIAARTNGPLRADLNWMLGLLIAALNETPWGEIVPQMIAAAVTDDTAKDAINGFMASRKADMVDVFEAAIERGELSREAPIDFLIDMAIAVPYHRKLVAGLPLDHDWLEGHIDTLCRLALKNDC